MSRPKYWWYHYVKESIMRNMSGTAPLTYQNYLVKIAVDKDRRNKKPIQRR